MRIGDAIVWNGTGGERMNVIRARRDIVPGTTGGTVGIVLDTMTSHGLTELYVMMNGRVEYFQESEVEVVSESR